MRVLIWHVHGSWTNAFVRGRHEYLLPLTPGRDADGRGRARTWLWREQVREVPIADLSRQLVDVVVLQRPHELDLVESWTGRVPGHDVPAVYVEHNTPPTVPFEVHPLAHRPEIPIVHVTQFNQLMWDCGANPARVIEHGVPDPGLRYTGEIDRAAVVVNEPGRRGRAVGADLLEAFAQINGIDLFGIGVSAMERPGVRVFEDLPQDTLHTELARRRMYLHPFRWTSLGLSLIEAMMLGVPVVALDTTEVSRAVPAGAGFVSSSPTELGGSLRMLGEDRDVAAEIGRRGREAAVARYDLARFLSDWDVLLDQITSGPDR